MKRQYKSEDFLSDELFIYWRLNATKELDEHWNRFLTINSDAAHEFHQAISEFDKICLTAQDFPIIEKRVKKYIDEKLINERRKRQIFIYAASVAAAVLLIFSSILFYYKNTQLPLDKDFTIGEVMSLQEIQLLSGNQIVTFGNNTVMDISQKENNAVLTDSISQKEVNLTQHKLNKLSVPFGKRTSIILSDGSKLYVNSGSEVEFPAVFEKNVREISVKGEVFIEVSKQTKRPFIVHTPNSDIQVLGTSFNISAYEDDEKEMVVIVSGSVQIASNNQSMMFKPDEMAEIKNGNIDKQQVNVSEYIHWKDGFMQFNKTSLTDVLKKIGRYYNVEFKYKNELNLHSKTCSGKLFLSDDLHDVLTVFSKMTFLHYQQAENQLIYIKKQPIDNK